MPDLFYLFSKWWKQILFIVVLSLAIVAIILFLQPEKYLSVTTAVPGNSYAADKASIFNSSIQELYPAMGTTDDLDKIVGTGQLDTCYIAVAEQFDLPSHYKTEEKEYAAILKSAYLLKTNTKVIKSDFSELKIKVWDTDRNLAPQLANAIMDKLQTIHQDLQNNITRSLIKSLETGKAKLQARADSMHFKKMVADNWGPSEAEEATRKALVDQVQEYQRLIGEYELLLSTNPPVLNIVERARAASWPDKPKKLPILVATFILSLLFALMVVLLIERRKQTTK